MARTMHQKIYEILLKHPSGMLSRDLRRMTGMTSAELNHVGDRLKGYRALTTRHYEGRDWLWTAVPGADVSDKRGFARRGQIMPGSRRDHRLALRAEAEAAAAKAKAEADLDARRPLCSRLRHPLDIAWAAFTRQMLTDRR